MADMFEVVFQCTEENQSKAKTSNHWLIPANFLLSSCLGLSMRGPDSLLPSSCDKWKNAAQERHLVGKPIWPEVQKPGVPRARPALQASDPRGGHAGGVSLHSSTGTQELCADLEYPWRTCE